MAKKKALKRTKVAVNLVAGILAAVLKAVSIDLFKNIAMYSRFAFNPEEKEKMKRKLGAEKKAEVLDERLKVVERLTYSIFKNPKYSEKDEGKYDLKELKKAVKR